MDTQRIDTTSRYKLDVFRASGKIAWEFGFHQAAVTLVSSGYSFEYDCCMFASTVLNELGILHDPRYQNRVYGISYFTTERKHESGEYFVDNFVADPLKCWGPQHRIILPSVPHIK